MDIFRIVIVFVIVLAMAYFFTKWLASAKTGGKSKNNIRVIESCGVGAQSYVQIMRVGKKYVLLGVSKSGVSLLAELDPRDIEAAEPRNSAFPFEKILSTYLPRLKSGSKGDGRD